jgi:outer membrane lipoprotein carrier protein
VRQNSSGGSALCGPPEQVVSYLAVELSMAVGITGFLSALVASPAPQGPRSAEALAHRIEERHRGLVDLQAQFVQKYRSGALGREIVERGRVSIKPPGRMLWEYQEPEKKTFVSDGKTSYFYVPADRQVIVRDQAGERSIPASILAGESILAEFEVALEPTLDGLERLRLTPRKADPEVEQAYLEVDEAGRIRSIEVLDVQGNRSEFRFEGIRENLGLPDRLFRFEIPRGVEVISG